MSREEYIEQERNDLIYTVNITTLQNVIDYVDTYWEYSLIRKGYYVDDEGYWRKR